MVLPIGINEARETIEREGLITPDPARLETEKDALAYAVFSTIMKQSKIAHGLPVLLLTPAFVALAVRDQRLFPRLRCFMTPEELQASESLPPTSLVRRLHAYVKEHETAYLQRYRP